MELISFLQFYSLCHGYIYITYMEYGYMYYGLWIMDACIMYYGMPKYVHVFTSIYVCVDVLDVLVSYCKQASHFSFLLNHVDHDGDSFYQNHFLFFSLSLSLSLSCFLFLPGLASFA